MSFWSPIADTAPYSNFGGRRGGTPLTSWTKFSLGSSKPRRSRFPLGERPRRLLLRNSPRADELSSFSPQATGPDDSRFGVPLAILRSSCILQRQSAAFQCLEPSRGAGVPGLSSLTCLGIPFYLPGSSAYSSLSS